MPTTITPSPAAYAAAERIFAVAAENGNSRAETLQVAAAVYAVRLGRTTDVSLTDTDQHRRRRLAHVIGSALHDAALDPAEVYAAVTAAGRATGETPGTS